MNYSLHPAAEQDLREAAEYYRERAGTVLVQAFIDDFEHAMQLVLLHPLLGASWRHGVRRLVMRHFPYSVIYAIVGEEVRVLAVAHHNRRPGYWRKRA